MELKLKAKNFMQRPLLGSNRTFMELKWLHYHLPLPAYARSNRTFMELKFS